MLADEQISLRAWAVMRRVDVCLDWITSKTRSPALFKKPGFSGSNAVKLIDCSSSDSIPVYTVLRQEHRYIRLAGESAE